MTDNANFTELVGKAKRRDLDAFEQIVSLTENRLFRFCFRLCGQTEMAKEICQDTYLKAFQSFESLKNEDRLIPWLFTLARNHFIDRTRSAESKIENRKESSPDETADLIALLPDSSPRDSDLIIGIQNVLNQLPEDSRNAIVLVDLEGYTVIEAAQIVGISEAALKSRLRRARNEFFERHEKKVGA